MLLVGVGELSRQEIKSCRSASITLCITALLLHFMAAREKNDWAGDRQPATVGTGWGYTVGLALNPRQLYELFALGTSLQCS